MSNRPCLVVVDADPVRRAGMARALGRDHMVVACADLDVARAALESHDVDAVILDALVGVADGVALCAELRDTRSLIPVVLVASSKDQEVAVRALRAGAWDFLSRPFADPLLREVVRRAIEHRRLRTEVRELRRRVRRAAPPTTGMIGESGAMRRLATMLDRVARAPSTVLLVGESGTGKELAARALHDRGPRSRGPFVAINCAAVPDSLLESELFGHVKGAFTDARGSRAGLFAQANGGTLFLDEIGDMPEGLQVKLLRTLQERTVRPLGGDREVKVDVRLVTATHRDLERLVDEGRFRHDLLYRLDVIRVELPPLRRRGRDVLLLAAHFIDQLSERLGSPAPDIPAGVAQLLLDYDWPGNVRELQNCVERLVVLAEGDTISEGDLPPRIRRFRAREHTVIASTADPSSLLPLAEVERRYVLEVLKAAGGSRSVAARLLGIDRKTLYRKLARWGEVPGDPAGPRGGAQSSSSQSS